MNPVLKLLPTAGKLAGKGKFWPESKSNPSGQSNEVILTALRRNPRPAGAADSHAECAVSLPDEVLASAWLPAR